MKQANVMLAKANRERVLSVLVPRLRERIDFITCSQTTAFMCSQINLLREKQQQQKKKSVSYSTISCRLVIEAGCLSKNHLSLNAGVCI